MKITDVRVRLSKPGGAPTKLLAYCAVTFDDCFIVTEIKVLCAPSGRIFVAFPNRIVTDHCPGCGHKNEINCRFCNYCGTQRAMDRAELDKRGRPKIYDDILHPINAEFREELEREVVAAYRFENDRAQEESHERPENLSR